MGNLVKLLRNNNLNLSLKKYILTYIFSFSIINSSSFNLHTIKLLYK